MPQELILISASQRNPIFWSYNVQLRYNMCALTCMNDLTGAKVLEGERIMFNAFKDIYFISRMKFEKLSTLSRVQKS
jgi:hypothetical protein